MTAALYGETTLGLLGSEELGELAREKLRRARLVFALVASLLLGLSEAVRRVPALTSLAARPRVSEVGLAVLAVSTPLALLELGLRPFATPKTTIFVEDAQLGWRLRPGARGEWGGTHVSINARGLRGPELPYARHAGATRILYLGDSVTFGYRLTVDQSYPYVTQRLLEQDPGGRFETVNAGVGGYAPWQELRYLKREGLRYEPDLIVVGFVLNDFTEKLSLIQFGGSGRGAQLARTARSQLDRWLSGSGLLFAGREALARLRFGPDVASGARRREDAEVRWLAREPDHPTIVRGWRIARRSLDAIFQVAAQRDVPAALVVFPYAFQLDAPRRSAAPQRRLMSHAATRGVPALDLLPVFAAAARVRGVDALFLDPSHPSAEGHRLAAGALADFLVGQGLVSDKDGG